MMHRRTLPMAVVFALALVLQACSLPDLKEERENAVALPDLVPVRRGRHAGSHRSTPARTGSSRWKDIPEVMADATVAIEDQRFWDHAGVDLKALLRGGVRERRRGSGRTGRLDDTQQLVKNLYVGGADELSRKFKEAYLAWQLEQELSKEEILTQYLNTVYFGNGAYGVQAAAQTYFGIDATDLRLPQAALLAGVIRLPSDYDPVTHLSGHGTGALGCSM